MSWYIHVWIEDNNLDLSIEVDENNDNTKDRGIVIGPFESKLQAMISIRE